MIPTGAIDGLIPQECKRLAYQATSQDYGNMISQIEALDYIAGSAKRRSPEDSDVKTQDRRPYEGHGCDPEKLSHEQ